MNTIPFPSLLDELLKIESPHEQRVKRIYHYCLGRHPKWAYEISRKYGYILGRPSDLATAFGWALMASQNKEI